MKKNWTKMSNFVHFHFENSTLESNITLFNNYFKMKEDNR